MKVITTNLDHRIDEGWSVHLYSGDRRLLFTLEASHVWIFVLGIITGFLIAAIGLQNSLSLQPNSDHTLSPDHDRIEPSTPSTPLMLLE